MSLNEVLNGTLLERVYSGWYIKGSHYGPQIWSKWDHGIYPYLQIPPLYPLYRGVTCRYLSGGDIKGSKRGPKRGPKRDTQYITLFTDPLKRGSQKVHILSIKTWPKVVFRALSHLRNDHFHLSKHHIYPFFDPKRPLLRVQNPRETPKYIRGFGSNTLFMCCFCRAGKWGFMKYTISWHA